MNIPVEAIGQFGSIAKNGSPLILSSFGRIFGLGDSEQKALLKGEFPRWAVLAIGLGAGLVGGAYLHKKYPSQVGKIIGR